MKVPNTNVEIPEGCTHWFKNMYSSVCQYRFYKVCGPAQEEVFIWWEEKWMPFSEFQDWLIKHTPLKYKVKMPNFDNPFFQRPNLTANEKIAAVKRRIDNATSQDNSQ